MERMLSPHFRAGKMPKTPSFALCFTETLAAQATMMARKFYTPYDVTVIICIFWPRAECDTFWLELAKFETGEKIRTRLSKAQTRKLRIRGSYGLF